MIDRLPRCLHTCLNCKNAVLCEEYRGPSRKIIFEGCWKVKGIKTPVDGETCEKFEESPDRVKRSFWKKWKGCIYIAEEGYSPGSGQKNAINYESFETADNLVCEDSGNTQYHAGEEHKLKDLPTIDKLPFIQGLPAADELSTTEEYGPPAEECELINEECKTVEKDELIAELDEDTAKESEDDIEGCEDPVENQKVPAGHDPIDSKGPTHRVSKQKDNLYSSPWQWGREFDKSRTSGINHVRRKGSYDCCCESAEYIRREHCICGDGDN